MRVVGEEEGEVGKSNGDDNKQMTTGRQQYDDRRDNETMMRR